MWACVSMLSVVSSSSFCVSVHQHFVGDVELVGLCGRSSVCVGLRRHFASDINVLVVCEVKSGHDMSNLHWSSTFHRRQHQHHNHCKRHDTHSIATLAILTTCTAQQRVQMSHHSIIHARLSFLMAIFVGFKMQGRILLSIRSSKNT